MNFSKTIPRAWFAKMAERFLYANHGSHVMNLTVQSIFPLLLIWWCVLSPTQAGEIHDAAEADDVARIRTLTATNRDLVHLAGKDDLTPLHTAARAGKLKAVAVLLESGAEVSAKDAHGCTPLHSAVYGHHLLAAECLIDHGANVNAARTDGTTPLYYAAAEGRTNLVSLLLKHSAKPGAAAQIGFTPLHAAARAGHVAVAEMLLAAGASVAAMDDEGHTPLHTAVKSGRREMAEWLLNHGADADAKDRLRFRPLDYATGVTNDALAALLEGRMKSRLEQSLPLKVGEAGDADHMVFEGVKTFTPEQIRHALAVKPSYLLAAHPQADMRSFLGELKTMVESGYQAAGFPDGAVGIRYEERAFRIVVNVIEGPRFLCGGIRVAGARLSASEDLVKWFTQPANTPQRVEALNSTSIYKELKDENSGATWKAGASVDFHKDKRPGGLDTPGKVARPDEPIWVPGDPADFTRVWVTQAVAQVEACLAEQGFFFPKAKVELLRNAGAGTADLLITLQDEGPPGVVGEINITGMERHSGADIVRFLDLREGMRITADRLAVARQKLRDCGRFWDFDITPEYVGRDAVVSRRVKLSIEVKEQEGVPRLGEPLSPVQQALLRLCDWIEQFPARDEDIQINVTNQSGTPFTVEFVVSPRRGLLLTTGDKMGSPVSAGFLLSQENVQLCAWSSGNQLTAARGGGGNFVLHLQPDKSGGTNHFHFFVGAGYQGKKAQAKRPARPVLDFDVQLARAAFLDFGTRLGGLCFIEGDSLMMTNEGMTLRAEAATGRLIEMQGCFEHIAYRLRCGVHVWDQASRGFARRAAALTNSYTPGHGLSSLGAFVATEAARWLFTAGPLADAGTDPRLPAVVAMHKLLNPELLSPVDRILGGNETNTFIVPLDGVDRAMAMNSLAAFFSGFAFEWSSDLFPKYSWPWTAAREAAFVMISQGRYTDMELDRLYKSEDTGPIGCLVLARLLSAAGSPAARNFALQGVTRLRAEDFLRDCNLFLRGETGLARSFAKTTAALRNLPDNELAALATALPEAEATLLRESAAALREKPDAPPATVLPPIIGKYWEGTLRAKVRAALYRLMAPPRGKDKNTSAALGKENCKSLQI